MSVHQLVNPSSCAFTPEQSYSQVSWIVLHICHNRYPGSREQKCVTKKLKDTGWTPRGLGRILPRVTNREIGHT